MNSLYFACLFDNLHMMSGFLCCDMNFVVGVEMGDWQEVWDAGSGCYYYWNTLSNEVSWELPNCLADQVQSLGQGANM